MTPAQIWELIGYVASAIVLVSLLMTSVVKLRILNGLGALIFAVYALVIRSYPTAVMNFCLVAIDLYFLVKVLRHKALFSVEHCRRGERAVDHFLRFYDKDIRAIFPGCDPAALAGEDCYLVYADAAPVGLLVGTLEPGDSLRVDLDYSAPSYRDCSVGKYLYGELARLGVRELRTAGGTPDHRKYLRSVGFRPDGEEYVKPLS